MRIAQRVLTADTLGQYVRESYSVRLQPLPRSCMLPLLLPLKLFGNIGNHRAHINKDNSFTVLLRNSAVLHCHWTDCEHIRIATLSAGWKL